MAVQVIEPLKYYTNSVMNIHIALPGNRSARPVSLALNAGNLFTILDGIGRTTPIESIIVRSENAHIGSQVITLHPFPFFAKSHN
jgi:hypothetical protein